MPLGIVLSQNAGKYLLSSPMWGVTIGFMLGGGAPIPSWLPLHCEVLTSSQEPRDQGEKPSSVPVSFNTPNTSAWNNWTSTSHRLLMACCLVCLSYLSPWILTPSQWDTEAYFLCFSWLCPHTLFLALCWIVGRLYGENCGIRRGPVSEL